jgi:hypothetical protein
MCGVVLEWGRLALCLEHFQTASLSWTEFLLEEVFRHHLDIVVGASLSWAYFP